MYAMLLTPARGVVMPAPAKAKTKRVRREKLYESCIVRESISKSATYLHGDAGRYATIQRNVTVRRLRLYPVER